MFRHAWEISFIVASILSILFSVLIARKMFKTEIESSGSRILIISAIANTLLWIILCVLQSVFNAQRAISSNSFALTDLLVPGVFLGVAFRIIWNYAAIRGRPIRQFYLKQVEKNVLTESVASLSKRIGIPASVLMSSSQVRSPFVFGRKSKQAILAIPEDWQTIENPDRYAILLHELAHIRNHDVGFLAWSQACIKDLRYLAIIFPALFVLGIFVTSSNIAPFAFVYFVCSIILYILLKYVVRQRETLADLTAAMLVDSEILKDLVSRHEEYSIGTQEEPETESPPLNKLHRWLTDKALFSKSPRTWRFILKLFGFVHTWHPSKSDRLKSINSINIIQEKSYVLAGESFGAGMLIGLFGVIVGLATYWFAPFAYNSGDMRSLGLPHRVYGLTAPMVISFLVTFLVLPVWSSLKQEAMNKRLVVSLLARYSFTLLGASLICPLILTAGTTVQIRRLFIVCLIWCIHISFVSSAVNIVGIFLWQRFRYLQPSLVKEIIRSVWSFTPFVTVTFGFLTIGFIVMTSGRVFDGANIIFSVIVGCVSVLVIVGKTRFSRTEHYLILRVFRGIYHVEGQRLNLAAYLIDSIGCVVILLAFGMLTYAGMHFMFGEILQDIDSSRCLIILIMVSGIILIIVDRYESRTNIESKRLKIYMLYDCLDLLLNSPAIAFRKKIRRIVESYDLPAESNKAPSQNLTIGDVNELVAFITDDPTQDDKRIQAVEWILACQNDGGFGVWPGSGGRLQSTYQALSILSDLNALDRCKRDSHIRWIKECWQPNGSFKGPWSKRPAWENTFFAVKSLDILEFSLDLPNTQTCQDWCRHILIDEGIEKTQYGAVYHCLGALTCLGKVDFNTLELVSNWLLSKTDELLLTNVSLDYENVHFAVMTYHLLNVRAATTLKEDQMNLLSQRIHIALEAELTDIPA